MCNYCEKKDTITRMSKKGDYMITDYISIKPGRLVIENDVVRYTRADAYYESWGLDVDRNGSNGIFNIPIKYCPFCGKQVGQQRNGIIWICNYDYNAFDEFVENHEDVKSEIKRINELKHDSSPLPFALEKLLFRALDRHLRNELICLFDIGWVTDKGCHLTKVDYLTIGHNLGECNDIYIRMDSDYSKKVSVIRKLKKLGYEIKFLGIENIKYDNEKLSFTFD